MQLMSPKTGNDLYFAYGLALDFETLSKFFPELVALLEPVGHAQLFDRELAFTRYSAVRAGGVLDVRPRKGSTAWGMLFKVALGGWTLLDRTQGATGSRPAYRRFATRASNEARGGSVVTISTYEVVERRHFVQPDGEYLERVRRGITSWGLATGDLDRVFDEQRAWCNVELATASRRHLVNPFATRRDVRGDRLAR